MTTNPLLAHSTHVVLSPTGGIHFLDFTDGDDAIHRILVSEPIVIDGSFEVDGVASDPHTPMPYKLVSDSAPIQFPTLGPVSYLCYIAQASFILIARKDQIGLNDIHYII